LRFILKVFELDEVLADKLGTSWKPEPVAANVVASASPVLPPATGSTSIPAPAAVNSDRAAVSPSAASTSAAVASSVSVVLPAATATASNIVASQSAVVIPDAQTSVITLENPGDGRFLNPFNGFRFKGDTLLAMPAEEFGKMVRIFLRAVNGVEIPVKGSFFSPEPGVLVFLPEKIVPGAVYTVSLDDPLHNQKKILQISAFPEIKTAYSIVGTELKIRIYWAQNPELLPNPAGQMIALSGSRIVLSASETAILTLDADQGLLPFGALEKITYRAQPYEIELSVPLALVENGCSLEIFAAIDGSAEKVSAIRSSWENEEEASITEEDGDYSDVEAVYHNVVGTEPAQAGAPETIVPIASLSENAAFVIDAGFSILENEADAAVAWPHDLCWDSNGMLWILDSQKRRISSFSRDGKLRTAFGSKGELEGSLGLPVALAVHGDLVYVSDSSMHAIHKFSSNGNFLGMIRSDPAAGLLVDLPGGICFRKEEMWVADRGTSRIMCFNPQGGFLGSFGSTAAAPIQAPISIRADSESLFILEKNGLVKKFSPMGHFDATFQTGCREGLGFDVDPWGGIWVCDAEKFKVFRFSRNGKLLTELSAPPAPRPWLPTAIAVRADGKVAVTDAQNKMLHIFVPEK
jgi:sugar lactone lactonase YvrE